MCGGHHLPAGSSSTLEGHKAGASTAPAVGGAEILYRLSKAPLGCILQSCQGEAAHAIGGFVHVSVSQHLSRSVRGICDEILMQFMTVAKAQRDPDSHIHGSGECSDLTSPILRCSALVPAADAICKLLGLGPYLSKIQGLT